MSTDAEFERAYAEVQKVRGEIPRNRFLALWPMMQEHRKREKSYVDALNAMEAEALAKQKARGPKPNRATRRRLEKQARRNK